MIGKFPDTEVRMLDELIHWDKELFLLLNNAGNPGWDNFWLLLSNKWSAIPLYLLLLILCLKQLGLRRTIVVVVTVALMVAMTDQLSNFFKNGFQRLRPCYDTEVAPLMRLVKNSCGGRFGFYSAHASNTIAVAMFFTQLLQSRWALPGLLLFLWALLVGYSRVFLGVHYPGDVAAGMFSGLLLGWIFSRLYLLFIHKYHV